MTFSSFKSAIPWNFDSESESETLNTEISRPNPSPNPSLQPRVSEFRVRDERLGKFWSMRSMDTAPSQWFLKMKCILTNNCWLRGGNTIHSYQKCVHLGPLTIQNVWRKKDGKRHLYFVRNEKSVRFWRLKWFFLYSSLPFRKARV